jgi:hydrogenase nickel incorporation protein HypA/HybF
MHELSIAMELVRVIREELRVRPEGRLRSARVRIGSLRQVEPSTLKFCFDAATKNTALAGAQLRVDVVEAAARCQVCRSEFEVEYNWFECPRCGTIGAELLRGDELQFVSLEIEKEMAGAPTH